MIAGIILAGGNGTRMNSKEVNKVALPFQGKPLIQYGVEVLQGVADAIVVVVGAHEDSVRGALEGYNLEYVLQPDRLGTAHAVQCTLSLLESTQPKHILIGYGDHMMFYHRETFVQLIREHEEREVVLSLLTTTFDRPNELAWGRILRDGERHVKGIVEQKDATEEQRTVKEVNPGFYCVEFEFLKTALPQILPSPITGEYYLTDIVKIAVESGKQVHGMKVPFSEVGIGINTKEELINSQKMHQEITNEEYSPIGRIDR